MEFEIIKKNVPFTHNPIDCHRCKKTDCENWNYVFLKNTFYCNECYKDIYFINSPLDEKIDKLEKQGENLLNGAVSRNKEIKKIMLDIEEIRENIKFVNNFIQEIINKSEENNIQ
jgi:tetrahydromethanopterin S-methyltransferase subunit B